MKYEAVFGNQDLFDGAGTFTGLDVVTRSIASGNMMCCRLIDLTPQSLREYPVIAMRRIIKEPKRWTVADQKAGRLPEVGAEYDVDGCIVEHLGNGAAGYQNIFYFKYPSGACGNAYERLAKPIETPDDKAAWLENEFYLSVKKDWNLSISNKDESFELGIRVAYRKLKGGVICTR